MFQDISRIVDKYFAFMEEVNGLHYIPDLIPERMKEISKPSKYKGSQRWKAIPSNVTDAQILEYENHLRIDLPESYKFFIKHKNFIELTLGDFQVDFFKNLSDHWIDTLLSETQHYMRFLEGRHLIPFARYSDYGVICFDARNNTRMGYEYPIVWLDHEDGFNNVHFLEHNFVQLFLNNEEHLDNWINDSKNNRIQGA